MNAHGSNLNGMTQEWGRRRCDPALNPTIEDYRGSNDFKWINISENSLETLLIGALDAV